MARVYLLFDESGEERACVAVFSTRDEARRWSAWYPRYDIEEHVVDLLAGPPTGEGGSPAAPGEGRGGAGAGGLP